jgi:hypothetical protein
MHVLALFLGDGHVLYFEWGGEERERRGATKATLTI